MSLLNLRLFGEFTATDFRGNVIHVPGRTNQALVALIALSGGGSATFADIARLLFGGPGFEVAVIEALRDLRFALRSTACVHEEDGVVRLRDVAVDVHRFEEFAADDSIAAVRQAAQLYSGNLLEGFSLTASAAFDRWIAERRNHYRDVALGVFARLLSAQIEAGWWENAVETAGRLLSIDPTQEVVHRTLMRLQLEQGRPDAALRRYHECADVLRREFQRLPSYDTERLHDEIEVALARTPAPRGMYRNPVDRPVLILLLEDDLVSSALVEGFLTDAGYQVVTVADGADALIEVSRREFDLLILDVNVPTLSGLKLFEIMIQKGMETPAVFITGIAGPEAEARSLEMGAADFLRKPIRKETLLPRVRSIIARRERVRASR